MGKTVPFHRMLRYHILRPLAHCFIVKAAHSLLAFVFFDNISQTNSILALSKEKKKNEEEGNISIILGFNGDDELNSFLSDSRWLEAIE